jgi:hypothetical protein
MGNRWLGMVIRYKPTVLARMQMNLWNARTTALIRHPTTCCHRPLSPQILVRKPPAK